MSDFNTLDGSTNRRQVCARCAEIKQACSGEMPCSRCKRLHVECVRSVDGRLSGALSKPIKITRTHTGCVTCKRRRRKCDEARPRCGDCKRLCLECTWSPPRPRSKSSQSTDADDVLAEDSVAIVPTRSQDEFSMVEFDSETWDPDSVDWTELSTLLPLPVLASDSPESLGTASSGSDLSLMVLSSVPSITLDEDKALLNHFTRIVANILSRGDDNQSNPYLTNLLPVAFSNQIVMDSVLALSANHWRKLQPRVWKRGMVHQTNALQSLAKLLPHIDRDSADIALLTTLVLCMTELFDGQSSHWQLHLDGARRLLAAFDQRKDWPQQSAARNFFKHLFHYLDSATTISTCRPPLLEAPKDESAKEPDSPDSTRYEPDDVHALYGIPKSLFHFVDKVNGLAYQRKFRDDPVFENMFQASAATVQKELDQWSLDYRADCGDPATSQLNNSAMFNASIAFEQALQLRLHQIVNGYSLEFPKVSQCVANILEAIQEIRYGSALEGCLVFPLVMAGTSCDVESDLLIVQDRLMIMERTLGFQYVYTARELVQKVWTQREETRGTGEVVNWASIRYFEMGGLAFL